MKRIVILSVLIMLLEACGYDECFKCQDITGYPNATICKDTYLTTVTDQSPSWADYCDQAVTAGCVKQ